MINIPKWVEDLNPEQQRKARALCRKIAKREDALKPDKIELERLRRIAGTYRARLKKGANPPQQ